jgi:hypothetical protein
MLLGVAGRITVCVWVGRIIVGVRVMSMPFVKTKGPHQIEVNGRRNGDRVGLSRVGQWKSDEAEMEMEKMKIEDVGEEV